MTTNNSLEFAFQNKANNLNLIRLIAALLVIYGHANAISGRGPPDFAALYLGYKFIGGIAVDVFFVISGFLITSSALNKNGLTYYAASRVLRIFPALIVCILITVLIVGPALTVSENYWTSSQTWKYLWRNSLAFKTEYFLPGVFETHHDKGVNGSLWSLVVEVRLYILIFLLALLGILKRQSLFNGLFFSVLLLGYFIPNFGDSIFAYENHRHVAIMFFIGAFCWINQKSIPLNSFILLVLFCFAAALHNTPKFAVGYIILLPYLVLYLMFAPGFQWFNGLGDYSYGVYLYGWLTQQLVLVVMPKADNFQLTIWPSLLALLLASGSWHLIEKPAMRFRSSFLTRS
jgi:peptidoglycan/LPS O-acetylase OafA/YrhL